MKCANPKCGKEFIAHYRTNPKRCCSNECRKEHQRIVSKEYYLSNKKGLNEYARKYYKKYRAEHRESYRESYNKWAALHPEIKKHHANKNGKKYINELSDAYIKSLIQRRKGIGRNDISNEVVEQKRLQVKIIRKIHENERAIKSL